MGNCCVAFWKGDARDDDSPTDRTPLVQSQPFVVKTALVDLPPNVYVNRVEPAPPTCCLQPKMFLSLQEELPLHLQHRKWRLLYGTEEHGFSFHTMKHNVELARDALKHQASCVLVVVAGGATFGAYLSRIPDFNSDKYVGTSETFVFAINNDSSCTVFPSVRATDCNAGNDYYMLCDGDALSIGGGGHGPGILLSDDMNSCSSSNDCPTFENFRCLLDATNGLVVVEGGYPRCPIAHVELWGISEEMFFVP